MMIVRRSHLATHFFTARPHAYSGGGLLWTGAIIGQAGLLMDEQNFRNYSKIYEKKLSDGIALNKPETL